MKPISLAQPSNDYPCNPSESSDTPKERFPDLYLELPEDPGLAPEGTLTVRYRQTEKTIKTPGENSDKSPMVRLCLEINAILDHSATAEDPGMLKSDRAKSADMLDMLASKAADTKIVVVKDGGDY